MMSRQGWTVLGLVCVVASAAYAQDRGTGVPTRSNPSGNYNSSTGPGVKAPSLLGTRRFIRGYKVGSRLEKKQAAAPVEFDPGRAPKAAPSVVRGRGPGADVSLSAPQLVALLGDPMYSQDGKHRTQKELLEGGMTAVPALIQALEDQRVYEEVTVQTPEGPRVHKVTVAMVADEMLYEIVTPVYQSKLERKMLPKSMVMFTVKDWRAWHAKRKGRSLEDVHQEVRAVMDRYWQSSGEEQLLE